MSVGHPLAAAQDLAMMRLRFSPHILASHPIFRYQVYVVPIKSLASFCCRRAVFFSLSLSARVCVSV